MRGRFNSCVSFPRQSLDSRGSTGRSQSTAPRRSSRLAGECANAPTPLELVLNFCRLALFIWPFVLEYFFGERVIASSGLAYTLAVVAAEPFVVDVAVEEATVPANGFVLCGSAKTVVWGGLELERVFMRSVGANVVSEKQKPTNDHINTTPNGASRQCLAKYIFVCMLFMFR